MDALSIPLNSRKLLTEAVRNNSNLLNIIARKGDHVNVRFTIELDSDEAVEAFRQLQRDVRDDILHNR